MCIRDSLGGGLADQQFNIAHVEGAAVQHFHKTQLQKDLQGSLHSADLLAGNGDVYKRQPLRRHWRRLSVPHCTAG